MPLCQEPLSPLRLDSCISDPQQEFLWFLGSKTWGMFYFQTFDLSYDIYIWHKSIWLSLVSKRPSGPQQSHLFIRFWLNNCLKIKKLKNALNNFPFINSENPLYFLAKLEVKCGLTFVIARNLIFFANHIHIKSGWEQVAS
jgi:hypothetical protein